MRKAVLASRAPFVWAGYKSRPFAARSRSSGSNRNALPPRRSNHIDTSSSPSVPRISSHGSVIATTCSAAGSVFNCVLGHGSRGAYLNVSSQFVQDHIGELVRWPSRIERQHLSRFEVQYFQNLILL